MINKKYFLLILSLLFISFLNLNATVLLKDNSRQLFPQKGIVELNLTYKYKEKENFTEVYDEDGKLIYIDKFYISEPEITASPMKLKIIVRDGKKIPIVEKYYSNGKLRSITMYELKDKDEDIEKNDIRKFYTSGKLKKDIYLYIYSEVCYENGNLKKRKMQRGDKSKVDTFYENGSRAMQISLIDKKIDGEVVKELADGSAIAYYPDGTLKSKVEFKEGLPNGNYENYHENGKLSEKTTMKDGKPNGKYEFYNSDGKLMGSMIYENGEVVNK